MSQSVAGSHQAGEPFTGNALAHIEHERHAQRQMPRCRRDLLWDTVVGHAEIARGEVGNRNTASHHRDVHFDEVDATAEHRLAGHDGRSCGETQGDGSEHPRDHG